MPLALVIADADEQNLSGIFRNFGRVLLCFDLRDCGTDRLILLELHDDRRRIHISARGLVRCRDRRLNRRGITPACAGISAVFVRLIPQR